MTPTITYLLGSQVSANVPMYETVHMDNSDIWMMINVTDARLWLLDPNTKLCPSSQHHLHISCHHPRISRCYY